MKKPIPLIAQLLKALTEDECPRCGASGDLITHDPITSQPYCTACLMDAAIENMKSKGTSQENIDEIKERLRLARQGVKLPPWEEKVSKPKNEPPDPNV